MHELKTDFTAGLNDCKSFPELSQFLCSRGGKRLSNREIAMIARRIEGMPEDKLKLALLADFTIDLLAPVLTVECAIRCQIPAATYVGAYSQYFEEILDSSSGLHRFSPNVIFLARSIRQLAPRIFDDFLSLSPDEAKSTVDSIVQELRSWVDAALQQTDATLLVGNFERPKFPQAGIADGKAEYPELAFYSDLNRALADEFRNENRVFVVDLDLTAGRLGHAKVCDDKMLYLAQMRWADEMMRAVAMELTRYLLAITGKTRKCLVLDLDNTIWGGIVGEDGVDGLRISPGDPIGEAYLEFQRRVRQLKSRGIILAIASKNNEKDAMDVFEKHTYMPLSLGDFTALRINWEPKHQNLCEIAEELSIGLDSMVFMDDSDFEVGLMLNMLPEVRSILLPSDPSMLASLIDSSLDYEKLQLTQEDKEKTGQYEQIAERFRRKSQARTLEDYLRSLETELRLEFASEAQLARIQQLVTKTNQFNLTTRRYTTAQIESMFRSADWLVISGHVEDIHGVLGTVAAVFIQISDGAATLDSFIMSCRALGRGIETAVMNYVKREVFDNRGINVLDGTYIPTKKNAPASNFYLEQGFEVLRKTKSGEQTFRLDSSSSADLPTHGIHVTWTSNQDGQ